MDVGIKHMSDCPINRADIAAADDIFGPNLGSLKGKTVRKANPHVITSTGGLPPDIMKLHKDVTLAIDIMFVNKIAFIMTIWRSIKFITCQHIGNKREATLAAALLPVIQLYSSRGFSVTHLLADGEFECIRGKLARAGVELNTTSRKEHVAEIKRCI